MTDPHALRKLLAAGWTTAENRITRERRPLAEMRDIITGTRGVAQSWIYLTSTDDQVEVPYDPDNPPAFLEDRSYGSPYELGSRSYGGQPPANFYTCRPWILPAALHPDFERNQWITDYPASPVDGSRAAYETACADAGVPPLTDEQITSYGNRYMQLDFINDPSGVRRIQSWLAGKRLKQIDAERQAAARERERAADAAFAARVAAGNTYVCAV